MSKPASLHAIDPRRRRRRSPGRPRKFSDEVIRKLCEWKSLKETAAEVGLTLDQAIYIREYYGD